MSKMTGFSFPKKEEEQRQQVENGFLTLRTFVSSFLTIVSANKLDTGSPQYLRSWYF